MPSFIYTQLASRAYSQLVEHVESTRRPYQDRDAHAFGQIYKSVYPCLSLEERQQAEKLVDFMIEGLERPELCSLLFGVKNPMTVDIRL